MQMPEPIQPPMPPVNPGETTPGEDIPPMPVSDPPSDTPLEMATTMLAKFVLSLALLASIGIGSAHAQSTTSPVTPPDTAAPARNPVQGDPAPIPDAVRTPDSSTRAAGAAEADKQPAGTENSNQPDRAAAGAGGGR